MLCLTLLALTLRSFTVLWKLPMALMFRQRYVLFFVCSRATMSRWNLYLWSWQLDLFWNTIIFVLLRFTVRAQVWQNLCRRSRCYCSPVLVGDRSTRSSANCRHLTSDSSRVRPGAAEFSSARANSLIYMLKRVGLKLHPCLTPRPCVKKCVFGQF